MACGMRYVEVVEYRGTYRLVVEMVTIGDGLLLEHNLLTFALSLLLPVQWEEHGRMQNNDYQTYGADDVRTGGW